MQDVNQLNYLSVWRYIIAYLHAHCKLNGINQKYIFIYIAAKFVIRKIFTSIKLFTPIMLSAINGNHPLSGKHLASRLSYIIRHSFQPLTIRKEVGIC